MHARPVSCKAQPLTGFVLVLLCRVLLERSLARQLPDELRLQYRYSTGGTVPVRIDLDQIDKFSSDTVSLRAIQYGGPRSM